MTGTYSIVPEYIINMQGLWLVKTPDLVFTALSQNSPHILLKDKKPKRLHTYRYNQLLC